MYDIRLYDIILYTYMCIYIYIYIYIYTYIYTCNAILCYIIRSAVVVITLNYIEIPQASSHHIEQ